MAELPFRPLSSVEEVADASADASAWGFPRPIHPIERDMGRWFRIAHQGVFWFEHYAGCDVHFVHLAIAPEHRRRWPVRAWLRFIARHVRDSGGKAIGFVAGSGFSEAASYLRRLGWTPTPYGLEKPLEV